MNIDNLPERLRLPAQHISHTCRISLEAAAVSLCASLAGIDGQWAGARDCNGVPISSRFNLFLAGNRGPLWKRLHQALTGTIESQARTLAETRHLLAIDKADFALARIRDRATDALTASDVIPADFAEPSAAYLRIDIIQRPTVFLRRPGKEQIVAGIRDSAEQLLLLDYLEEDFLHHLLRQKIKGDRHEFYDLLIAFIDGGQVEVGRGRGRSGSDIVRGKITTLFGATPESLHAALQSKCDTLSDILSRSAFIDLSQAQNHTPDQEAHLPPHRAHEAAYLWDRLIQEAFWRRRACGEGYVLATEMGNLPHSFAEYDDFLMEKLEGLPGDQHRYFTEAASWPVRILGTFLAVENQMNPTVLKRLKKGAQELAQWLVEHQASVLARASSSPSQYLEPDEAKMYQKVLVKGPMTFRELLRCYDSQKSDLHRPVMEQLLSKGKIVLNREGLLEAVKEEDAA